MKKTIALAVLLLAILFRTHNVSAQNNSFSLDPITFFGLLFSGSEEMIDVRNLWLCLESNFEMGDGQELGIGFFGRVDKFALRGQYRFYTGPVLMQGLFAGAFLQAEWQNMYWYHDPKNNDQLVVSWSFPYRGSNNVFSSIGATIGLDVGFRIRFGEWAISAFAGFGYPFYAMWGDMPPDSDMERFKMLNLFWRGLDLGIRIDFFPE